MISRVIERWEKTIQLINIGVEDAVDEADAGGFVGVLIGEFDVDFPAAALERCYSIISLHILCILSGCYALSSGPLNRT